MKRPTLRGERGNILICTMCTMLIVTIIGANVLYNCTTRYNVSSKQVKAWKEALVAAEAGGDVGYSVCRKAIGDADPATVFSAGGWATPSPAPTNLTWTKTVPPFGDSNSLSANVTVDKFFTDANGGPSYRIRSTGIARVYGLPRTGMDDRMGSARGDSLLRKIDFKYDHFKATYGDGDGNGLALVAVTNPQVARRVELIATPMDPFEGAVKCLSAFNGPGAASVVDSFDSHNGAYTFVANNPASPLYPYATGGNVAVNTGSFSESGPIYGSVGTNGGTVTAAAYPNIHGTIDNTISFTVPPITQPSPPTGISYQPGTPNTINPTAAATSSSTPDWYLYSNFKNVTINGRTDAAGHALETYVTIVVTGDVGGNGQAGMTIAKGVNAKIYFAGDYSMKASATVNNNVDGATGVYFYDGKATSTTPSTETSRAGHLQFFGINPPAGQTQTIDTNPGNNGGGAQLWAVFYAPGADFNMVGNPDLFGAVVCKTFSGNGDCGFHYDQALKWTAGPPVDYRIASYVEDVR